MSTLHEVLTDLRQCSIAYIEYKAQIKYLATLYDTMLNP